MYGFFDALVWLIEQYEKRALPKWAIPFMCVCTLIGAAIAVRMIWLDQPRGFSGGDIVLVILFAGAGWLIAHGLLLIYQWISGNLTD
jgi:hypothetical protein